MTSWLRGGNFGFPKKKEGEAAAAPSYFYRASLHDPATQSLELMYMYAHAQTQGRTLYVYDETNPSSPTTGFYSTMFQDLSGLVFVDQNMPHSTPLNGKFLTAVGTIQSFSVETFRILADKFFTVKKGKIAEVTERIGSLPLLKASGAGEKVDGCRTPPMFYDIGVYLPKEMQTSAVLSTYVKFLKEIQAKSGREDLNVFVLAADPAILLSLKKQVGAPGWTYYMPAPRAPLLTNSKKAVAKEHLDGFQQFLAEAAVLQNIVHLVVPLSTSMGKFLYLTCASPETLQTVDTNRFRVY